MKQGFDLPPTLSTQGDLSFIGRYKICDDDIIVYHQLQNFKNICVERLCLITEIKKSSRENFTRVRHISGAIIIISRPSAITC